jgi:hypothetical protein
VQCWHWQLVHATTGRSPGMPCLCKASVPRHIDLLDAMHVCTCNLYKSTSMLCSACIQHSLFLSHAMYICNTSMDEYVVIVQCGGYCAE